MKRPTGSASELRAADFREGAARLRKRLEDIAPLIVCFNGITACANYIRYAEGVRTRPRLGRQSLSVAGACVFVVPSPSPANAAYSLEDLAGWYERLAALRAELASPSI